MPKRLGSSACAGQYARDGSLPRPATRRNTRNILVSSVRPDRSQDSAEGCWRNSTTPPMGFGSFRRRKPGRSYCVGLPLQHLPLSGFLTLSAVSSRPGRVALFHTTSAHRILVFRAFPSQSAVVPLDTRSSLVVRASAGGVQQAGVTSAPVFFCAHGACVGIRRKSNRVLHDLKRVGSHHPAQSARRAACSR